MVDVVTNWAVKCKLFARCNSGSQVKFWQWDSAVGEDGAKRVALRHVRTLKMADDVLCTCVSPDGKLLAVALLDSTIKVRPCCCPSAIPIIACCRICP